MLAGLPRAVAPSFLAAARKIVARVQRMCIVKGATVADLPRPSRCAVSRLSALACLAPDDLRHLRKARTGRRLRISNITSRLAGFLEMLGGDPGSDVLAGTLEEMRTEVERIERRCRAAGASPGRLPERSAYAFAMMKWLAGWDVERLLAGPGRLGEYAAQARLARMHLRDATNRVWGEGPRKIDISFVPGHHIWRVRPRGGVAIWRLATGWLKARKRDFEDLVMVVARRRGRQPSHKRLERHRAFIESPGFREIDRELERLLAGAQYEPMGRFRDLGAAFERVNRRLFKGRIARPRLHWNGQRSETRFGSYDRVRDVVCVNSVLDDPRVPKEVTEFVLYHELLHKSHGFRLAGARRMAHTREFAADERRFPGWETASRWLELLAAGWDGPPPELAVNPNAGGRPVDAGSTRRSSA